jgi:hypothetical protein
VKRALGFPGLLIALFSVGLFMPGTAGAAANRFQGSIAPSVVQPPATGTYTIAIRNHPNSDDKATEATIAIPPGFVVDGLINPPVASIVSGTCAGPSWTVVAFGASSIDLVAPNASAALCDGGTLGVTFNVLVGPSGDGIFTWTTQLSAGPGVNFQAQSQPTLVVDSTPPPAPSIDSKPPSLTNQTSATFTFSDSEGGVSFQCRLDAGASAACSSPQSYSNLDAGLHTFYVKAVDAVGNEGNETQYQWTIDTTPPAPPTIDSFPPNPSGSTNATFEFSDSEGGVGFLCQLDGTGFTTCSSPQSYSGLTPNASHTFEVKAVDPAGNSSAVAPFTWTIDTAPPPAPVITSVPPNPSGTTGATFQFSDSESGVSFQCQLDAGGFSPCSSPQTYSNLADGSHTFWVKAFDLLDHESTTTSYVWTIDTVHPLVTLTDKPPLLTNQTTASFSFSSNKPSSSYECKLDNGSFGNCTSPRLYSGLDDGSHTFSVRATALGNLGPITDYTWTVDTVAPDTAITSTPPALSSSAAANFSFTSSEAGSTFACALDAGGTTSCESPKTYAGLGDGSHTFRVQAVDAAGNVDTSAAAFSWQIAGVGPGTTDTTPPGNVKGLKRTVGYGTLKLSWSRPSDADFDHVEVFVSTSAKSLPRTPVYKGKAARYTNRRFRNGVYYRYAVVSYDHAGNASRGVPGVVPPSILLRSPRDGRRVHAPPVLIWAKVSRATFYNVQLYYGSRKVLSAWPNVAKRKLSRSWRYGGRQFQLRKGLYRWYVWPGFGPRSKSRYGQLLGQSTFRLR